MVNPFNLKKIDTRFRTNDSEIMDDFQLEGTELEQALDKIAKINQLLGGNKLTLQGVQRVLELLDKNSELIIVDIGCGNGDMLRFIADFGLKYNYKFILIGIDANAFTINHAKKLSHNYKNIDFRTENIFDKPFSQLKYDIALCTLTLHHFKEEEIKYLLALFYANATAGIVINDLHRSKIAYRLFQLVGVVFRLNKMSREDGLTSILRGFKKQEIIDFSNQLGLKKYILQWKWAFRYQWIILKK